MAYNGLWYNLPHKLHIDNIAIHVHPICKYIYLLRHDNESDKI